MRCCALLCIALSVCAAIGDVKTLDLWLSTNSNVASLPAIENPVLPVGYTGKVYLYARSAGTWQAINTTYADANGIAHPWTFTDWAGDVWDISVASNTTIGFAGTIANPVLRGLPRWWTQADFTWATNNQFNVAGDPRWGDSRCVGWALPPAAGTPGVSEFDSQQACTVASVPGSSGYLYSRLGAITITNAPAGGALFMTVGWGVIDPLFDNDYNDLVHFGAGDAAVYCGDEGNISSLPDMTVMPEPSAFLLLGLSAFALRRR